MVRKKKIAVFGGTFNPVHFGHLRFAEEVAELLGLDQVLFVPSFNPPLKSRDLAPFKHRLAMVKKAISSNPSFAASDIESRIKGKSFTIHTLEALRKTLASSRMFFLMGSDAFLDLCNWYMPLDILALTEVVVAIRPPHGINTISKSLYLDEKIKAELNHMGKKKKLTCPLPFKKGVITFVRTSLLDISATEIRRRIRKGMSIKYLLPQVVESYIILNKLFLPERGKER